MSNSDLASSTKYSQDSSLLEICATACAVPSMKIEHILPATPLQAHRTRHHIAYGTYLTQTVATYATHRDVTLLHQYWAAVVSKNEILRTRLVEHDGQVWQVVLKFARDFVGEQRRGYEEYMQADRGSKMIYGTRMSRYAIVRDYEDTLFVWTVCGALVDEWSMKLIWEDMRDCCWDVEAFRLRPARPPFRLCAERLGRSNCAEADVSLTSGHLDERAMPGLHRRSPIRDFTDKSRHLEWSDILYLTWPKSGCCMLTLGHLAWSITIASLLRYKSQTIYTLSSARTPRLPNLAATTGPLETPLSFIVDIDPKSSIFVLYQATQDQLGKQYPPKNEEIAQNCLFLWNPPNADIFSPTNPSIQTILAPSTDNPLALLELRKDLSVPSTDSCSLACTVHEHHWSPDDGHGHLSIRTSVAADLMTESKLANLTGRFTAILLVLTRLMDDGLADETTVAEFMKDLKIDIPEQIQGQIDNQVERDPEGLTSIERKEPAAAVLPLTVLRTGSHSVPKFHSSHEWLSFALIDDRAMM